jgi:hypothetical protein
VLVGIDFIPRLEMGSFYARLVRGGFFHATFFPKRRQRRENGKGPGGRSKVSYTNYRPVLEWEASTGFDSGEPFSRSQIESTTIAKMAKNSLCQF